MVARRPKRAVSGEVDERQRSPVDAIEASALAWREACGLELEMSNRERKSEMVEQLTAAMSVATFSSSDASTGHPLRESATLTWAAMNRRIAEDLVISDCCGTSASG